MTGAKISKLESLGTQPEPPGPHAKVWVVTSRRQARQEPGRKVRSCEVERSPNKGFQGKEITRELKYFSPLIELWPR